WLYACLVQMKGSGNVFAVFASGVLDGSNGAARDTSGRTRIVSLVNIHQRPCCLKLAAHDYTVMASQGVALILEQQPQRNNVMKLEADYQPQGISLDHEYEKSRGALPLPFQYHATLLAGDQQKQVEEIECYQL